MRVTVAVLVSFAVLSSPPRSRAEVVTLESLEARAVRDRPTLDASRAKLRRATAGIDVAESGSRPTLGLGVNASLAPGGTLISVNEATGDPGELGDEYLVSATNPLVQNGEVNGAAFEPNFRYDATLRLDATIADFGRTRSATRAARAERSAARAEREATKAQIVLHVRAAYLSWMAAHALATVAEENATAAAARRGRVETAIQEGARPESDRAPMLADEASARLEVARARGRLAQARLALEQAAGGSLSPTAEPDLSILERARASERPPHDPAVTVLERQRDAARQNAMAAERQSRPVLSGRAEAGLAGQFGTVFPVYRVGLSLAIPLWDGGRQSAQAAVARASAAELDAHAREAAQTREADERAAQADFDSAEARLAIARELVDSCATRLRQAEERYDLGAGTIESVADARTTLLRAQSEEVLARVDRAAALLRLSR